MNVAMQRIVESLHLRMTPQMVRGADYQDLREYNRALVLNYLRQHSPSARSDIAKDTGLSRTTVSHIVDELLHEGFAQKGDRVPSSTNGGRSATLLRFNGALGTILGLDVGRSHLTILATDLDGHMVDETAGPMDLAQGPHVCIPQIVKAVRGFIAAHPHMGDDLLGIGVGIPGTLSALTRVYTEPPHMPGWDGVNLGDELRQRLGVPIFVDNDANMGALGESHYGIGRTYDHFIYMKVGTGIGIGIIINGRIYRGSGGFAGEVGHVSLDDTGPLCDCGNRGCLETLAGAGAIVAAVARERHGQPALTDIAEVIAAAQAGDAVCQRALARAGEAIGRALAILINVLNPTAIILDGSVSRAGDLVLDSVRRAVGMCALPPLWHAIPITQATLAQRAIALGCVATVIHEAFEHLPTIAMGAASGPP